MFIVGRLKIISFLFLFISPLFIFIIDNDDGKRSLLNDDENGDHIVLFISKIPIPIYSNK